MVPESANGGMEDKVVLITGGTSGIGKAATALVAMGAEVVVTGRNRERGEAAVEEIRRESGREKVSLMLADLAVQAEVRELAGEFKARYARLDVLVNNAGLIQSRRTETPEGIELTLAVNHLAPFLLTYLLFDLLERSAPSRIITVSSEARRHAEIDFDDLQSERRYRGFAVYGMTKLANILFTYELAERLRESGVVANCVHPGGVNTDFGNNNRSLGILLFRAMKPFMRTPRQGADTVVYLASSPEAGRMSGKYLMDCEEVSPAQPRDKGLQRRLREVSEELTSLRVPS
ncbi:MAG: SDR family oxidoreductase [Actinomycetota bacterium]|nr:SDR family oxidoreductase [Actinomycetota bacterium]